MTLPEARRRVAVSRLIGWVMIVLMGLAALLILAKMTYVTLSDNMGLLPGVRPLQRNPLQPIFTAYPIASRVWDLVPTGDNWVLLWLLMGCLLWGMIGGGFLGYAGRLNHRIRRARETIEERGWRRSLGEVQSTEGVLSIQLESEDRWYARPGGLLLIGLIITMALSTS